MKTKTKQVFKTAITIPILLLMMLLSFSVHAQTHVYNETTDSGIFPDPDGALIANPLSDAFNSSANCARAATGGFGKLQIFPTYTPGAADRLYFSIYNPGAASFAQVKFEYTAAPGVWEDGGDVYYGSASTTGWVEYSIGLAPNEGNTINKIILMPSGSSSVAVYADNIYFHTTSLYPTTGATHFFKDVVEHGLLFHSGAGIFNNPLPADPINSTVKCLRTNGTGAWRETQVFNARYVVKTADKLFISFYNPNNATQWQLRFTFRDGDYLGPADTAHLTAAVSGWNEVSVDLTSYIGKEIEKIHLYSAHDELKQVYSDNIYIGSASVIPQQPLVYNETISSGMWFGGTNGAQVSNPVSDVVNPSANVARSATDGAWQQIQYFPTYTVVAGNKLYFSVHNPNGATFGQVQFEYTTGGGWQYGGDVTYVSGSTTGWREYSIDLTGHVGNTINKIILMPAGDSSAAVYVDNVFFGSTSSTPSPQTPLVYNETISSGMWFQGTNGAQVSNPVSDVVNSSANVARSATDGSWQQIQYFPNYTVLVGNKLYFSVHNPNGATFGQVQFEYTTGGGWQYGGDVTYVSGSTTSWREYSIDLASHVGNTINKIILMPAGDSSAAVYVDNIFFASTSSTPSPQTPTVYNETISSGMWFQGTNGAQVANPVSDVVNSSANVARSATDGSWQQIQYFPNYTVVVGNKLYFSVHNPNGATFAQVQFEYTTGGGWQYGGDVTYVSGSTTGWREYSIDLTGHVGNTINKIILMPAGDSSAAVYVDNIFFASTSSTPSPQTPIVYDETISSGIWFQGTNGAQVANPVSDVVNSSANAAKSATDGGWQQIQYFPTYTVAAGNKLYFSVHNPNGATFGQVQFEYTTGGGWQYGGDVTYVSGSTTGWREYSIDLTGHVGNTINKIILMPAGDSAAAVYVDNIYFGTSSILPPAPQEPIVYNETISSGMFIDGDGSPVANPVKDLVNFSANCAKSGTGGWKKIEYFPTYTAVSGSKLYFSVHNPNNAGPGQVKFDYSTGETEQWGDNVTYVSGSVSGWREYSVDLTAHVGKTITKILMYPSGPSSGATYIDNVYFGTSSVIPQASAFCKGAATVTIAKGTTDLQLYTSPTSAALAGTTVLTSKGYYATLNGSARTAVTVTVNNLPATPSLLVSTESKNICKYIGSSTPVTFTATASGAVSYIWTVPALATIETGNGTSSIGVSFENTTTTAGAIGSVTVRSVDTNGCASAAKVLALTTVLPKAPASLIMTSSDSTPHFNLKDPATTLTNVVGLNALAKITKVGPYMQTGTVFTLTAAAAPTAASYAWTLPTGVTPIGATNSNVLNVTFDGAALGTTGSLPIVVKSVGGCGQSVARTLTLARAIPSAPSKLVLTEGATVVTKVGPYTGKSTSLTLTATPVLVQGATATSYAWVLPAGVIPVSTHTTGVTLTGSTTIEGVPTPWTINNAYGTTTNTLTVNFSGVASGVASLPLSVYGVNGTGNSKARTLSVSAAVPATPSIVGSGGTGTSGQFSSCLTKTYTATSTSTGITSYTWTIPADAQIVGAANGNVIVVNYSATSVAVGASSAVTCYATNGTGNSLTKSLTVKRMPATCRLADASAANDFKVSAYPNPSSSEFTIETSAKGAMSVKVYDMQGRLVEKADTNRVGSKLATGTYNVIVNQGANTKSVRVIKN